MQSILITGTTEKTRGKALEIIKQNNISKFDVDTLETEKAVGIGDIRLLQKRVFLKPLKSKQKAVILEAFQGMTIDSQNTFSKVMILHLNNTIIIILVNSHDFLLPTILSRCNIITLEKYEKLEKEAIEEYLKSLKAIQKGGNALKLAQDNAKTREEALKFLENLMLAAQENLANDRTLIKLFKNMQKTYTIIKTTNVSPRFALENLFLNSN
ncbi:MAG: hypothetical protein M1450_00085 [Patescibacteria group bacterium]|nr:hypothetical protein [Patescibacteria group bacterium]